MIYLPESVILHVGIINNFDFFKDILTQSQKKKNWWGGGLITQFLEAITILNIMMETDKWMTYIHTCHLYVCTTIAL